jgi:hypothetical protein
MLTESELSDLTKKKIEIWQNLNGDQLTLIFDDQGLFFNYDGIINSKEDLIKKIREEKCGPVEINFQKTIARIYGSSAVVSGEGDFTNAIDGQSQTTKLTFLDVWIERENGWKLVSTHHNQII